MWKGRGVDKDDKDGYFAFLRNEDGLAMTATLTIIRVLDADQLDVYQAQVVSLGIAEPRAAVTMNVRSQSQNGKPANEEDARQIIPIRYDIGKDGKLTLFTCSTTRRRSRPRSRPGKLKGTVREGSDRATPTSPPIRRSLSMCVLRDERGRRAVRREAGGR